LSWRVNVLPARRARSNCTFLNPCPEARIEIKHPGGEENVMARYHEITPAEMTPAQRRVHDLIVAGRRGRFGGPFQLLIHAPEIASMRHSSARISVGAPLCRTVSPSLRSSRRRAFGVRNTSGMRMPRWPRRRASLLPRL